MRQKDIANLILQAFGDAISTQLNDRLTEDVGRFSELCFDERLPEHSPMSYLMTGFLLGFREGLRIEAAMESEDDLTLDDIILIHNIK